MNDVGLLRRMANLDSKIVIEGDRLFEEFKGAFTENYILTMLNYVFDEVPNYFTFDRNEIDFVIQYKNKIIPIEVKSNKSTKNISLSKYNQKHLLNVFGPNSSNMSKSVIYHGQFSPNELPAQLNYNFGLVWDGDSVDTCSGDYGMYLKYNDPHKVSLYISSGLPVIIWKEAAVAKLIQQHHAGILIESLSEIDKVLSKISQDDYYQMRMNTLKLARLMRKGYFLDKSVNKLLNLMKVSGE